MADLQNNSVRASEQSFDYTAPPNKKQNEQLQNIDSNQNTVTSPANNHSSRVQPITSNPQGSNRQDTSSIMKEDKPLMSEKRKSQFDSIYSAFRGKTMTGNKMPSNKPTFAYDVEEDSVSADDEESNAKHIEQMSRTQEFLWRRKTTEKIKSWPNDSHNGQLSHSKMLYEVSQAHPRMVVDNQAKPMPCCKTRTGWFCCCKNARRNEDTSVDMGTGMTIYFKSMKSFMILFAVFTVMSIPAYLLYWNGTPVVDPDNQSNQDAFSRLTLGNIGQSSEECGRATNDGEQFTLFCSFGTMYSLDVYAVSYTNLACSAQGLSTLGGILDGCDISSQQSIKDSFDSQCYGKQSCEFTMDYDEFPSACVPGMPKMYAMATCLGGDITLVSGVTVDRTTLTYVVVSIDIAICIAYFIFLLCMERFTKIEEYEVNESKLSMSDFCVAVSNLPDQREYQSLDNLKVMLTKHFQALLPGKRQMIDKLKTDDDSNVADIANIFFGHINFEGYKLIMNMEKECMKITQLKEKQQKKPKSHDSYQKKIDKCQTKVIEYQDKYMQLDKDGTKDQIKTAYVVFKSMEGAARAIQEYNVGSCNRLCLKCCCRAKELQPKLFGKKWLHVSKAVAPSLIMWENLGSRKKGRCLRTTITSIIAIILCLATIIAIVYAKDIDTKSAEFAPTTNCPTEFDITRTMAYNDYQLPQDERQGYMPCYCKSYWIEGAKTGTATSNLEETFPNGEAYCMTWFESYFVQQLLILAIPAIISLTNSISKTVMKFLAEFEKKQNKADEVYSITRNMMLISFINTGLVILAVNFQLNLPTWLSWLPIFNGVYTTFSVSWYKNVGSTLAVTMIFFIITPHFSNFLFQSLTSMSRCCDRSCRCDNRRTKKLTQQEYETINIGAEFAMEFRYSNILVVVIITMMYSPGLPVLYPIAFGFFFVTYFVDKCMLLKLYRKPVMFDNTLALSVLFWFKFALVAHSLMGIFMFSNSQILPTSEQVDINYEVLGTSVNFNWGDLFSLHMVIYWGIFLGILLCSGFKMTIVRCLVSMFTRCREADAKLNEFQTCSNNFYETLNYQFLRREYVKNQSQTKRYEEIIKIGQVYKPQLSEGEMQKYIQKLKNNSKQMTVVFAQIADKHHINPADFSDTQGLLEKLDEQEQRNKLDLIGYLINSVQSYDILENPTFHSLQPIKKLLDRTVDARKVVELTNQNQSEATDKQN